MLLSGFTTLRLLYSIVRIVVHILYCRHLYSKSSWYSLHVQVRSLMGYVLVLVYAYLYTERSWCFHFFSIWNIVILVWRLFVLILQIVCIFLWFIYVFYTDMQMVITATLITARHGKGMNPPHLVLARKFIWWEIQRLLAKLRQWKEANSMDMPYQIASK